MTIVTGNKAYTLVNWLEDRLVSATLYMSSYTMG